MQSINPKSNTRLLNFYHRRENEILHFSYRNNLNSFALYNNIYRHFSHSGWQVTYQTPSRRCCSHPNPIPFLLMPARIKSLSGLHHLQYPQ